jgi:hypothetical protein
MLPCDGIQQPPALRLDLKPKTTYTINPMEIYTTDNESKNKSCKLILKDSEVGSRLLSV